jgi:hypothetical protein
VQRRDRLRRPCWNKLGQAQSQKGQAGETKGAYSRQEIIAAIHQCPYSIAVVNQCTYRIAGINQCTYSIAVIHQCTYSSNTV